MVLPAHGPPVNTSLYTAVVCSLAVARAWIRGSSGPSCKTALNAPVESGDSSSGEGEAMAASCQNVSGRRSGGFDLEGWRQMPYAADFSSSRQQTADTKGGEKAKRVSITLRVRSHHGEGLCSPPRISTTCFTCALRCWHSPADLANPRWTHTLPTRTDASGLHCRMYRSALEAISRYHDISWIHPNMIRSSNPSPYCCIHAILLCAQTEFKPAHTLPPP